MTDLQDEIERFDRLAEGLDDAELEKRLTNEISDLSHKQTFTAVLSEEQRVEAGAEIDLDGQVESVTVYHAVNEQRLDPTPVEPCIGVWRTVVIWWEHMRTTVRRHLLVSGGPI
ncbi:hypothetical protein SB749_15000 [Brevibacterium sp. SIMBA_078]|uniref:hypothetical protein n=1 Tax=Brevibacterium sp. SIMBA_078 TaxID=3085816 RepID=UPI0039792731